jgi:hypothetical protein
VGGAAGAVPSPQTTTAGQGTRNVTTAAVDPVVDTTTPGDTLFACTMPNPTRRTNGLSTTPPHHPQPPTPQQQLHPLPQAPISTPSLPDDEATPLNPVELLRAASATLSDAAVNDILSGGDALGVSMTVTAQEADHISMSEHNLHIATDLLDVEIDNAFSTGPTLDPGCTPPTPLTGDILERAAAAAMGQWRQLIRELAATSDMARRAADIIDVGLDNAPLEGQPVGLRAAAYATMQGQDLLDAAGVAITQLRQLRAGVDTSRAPDYPPNLCDDLHDLPEGPHADDVGTGLGPATPTDDDATVVATAFDTTATTTTASHWAFQSGVFTHAPPVTSSMADDVMETNDCGTSTPLTHSILPDSMAPPLTQHYDHFSLPSLVADAALDLTDEGQSIDDGKATAAPTAQFPRADT